MMTLFFLWRKWIIRNVDRAGREASFFNRDIYNDDGNEEDDDKNNKNYNNYNNNFYFKQSVTITIFKLAASK